MLPALHALPVTVSRWARQALRAGAARPPRQARQRRQAVAQVQVPVLAKVQAGAQAPPQGWSQQVPPQQVLSAQARAPRARAEAAHCRPKGAQIARRWAQGPVRVARVVRVVQGALLPGQLAHAR